MDNYSHYNTPYPWADFDTALAEIIHRSSDHAVVVLVTEDIVEWNDIIYRRVLAKLTKLQVQEEGEEQENELAKEQAAKYLLEKRLRFVGFAHYRCVCLLTASYQYILTVHFVNVSLTLTLCIYTHSLTHLLPPSLTHCLTRIYHLLSIPSLQCFVDNRYRSP